MQASSRTAARAAERIRRSRGTWWAGLLLCCSGPALATVEVQSLTVQKMNQRYHVDMQVRMDASAQDAYSVFARPENLNRINPAVVDAREDVGPEPGLRRWYTEVRVCVSFYCRRLHQVQDMHMLPNGAGGTLSAEVVPALSDLRYGRADWRIWPCGDGTCLSFSAELEPDFWIPPFIGPWILERKLRDEALQTAQGIERLAQALD